VDEAISILDKTELVSNAAYFGKYVHVTVPSENGSGLTIQDRIKSIKELLSDRNGINVKRVDEILPSLEDVFVNLLERSEK
jgi:hypothetical protein